MCCWLRALVLIAGCAGAQAVEANETVLVGAVVIRDDEATGYNQSLAVERAYEEFFKRIDNSAFSLGANSARWRAKLELRDGGADPATAAAAAQKLADEGVRLFLGPHSSSASAAVAAEVAKVAEEGGVLLTPAVLDSPFLDSADQPVVFSLGLPTQTALAPVLELLSNEAKAPGSVALLQQEGEWASACSSVELLAAEHSMTFLGNRTANDDESIAEAVSWLREQQPELVVACLGSSGGLCESFLNEIEQHRLDAKATVVTECLPSADAPLTLRNAARWMMQPVSWSPYLSLTSAKYSWASSDFAEWYRRDFDEEPPVMGAAAWAACAALVEALEQAASSYPQQSPVSHVASKLQSLDLQTLYGRVTFDSQGQLSRSWKVLQLPPVGELPRLVYAGTGDDAPGQEVLHYPAPPRSDRPCYFNEPSNSILGFNNTEFSNGTCSKCPQVSVFVNKTRFCQTCDGGEAPLRGPGDTASCEKCEPGKRWRLSEGPEAQPQCELCAMGTFSVGESATKCELCESGTFASQPGSSECGSCPAGRYAPIDGSMHCLLCPQGKFANSTRQSRCEFCKTGEHSEGPNNRSECRPCPPGTSSNVSVFRCEPCEVGKHQPHAGKGYCIPDTPGLESMVPGTAFPNNSAGYWMVNESTVLPCYHERRACLEDKKCRKGHTGRFCYSCSPGYARGLFTCFKCPHLALNIFVTVLTLGLSVVCVLWAGRFVVHSVGSPQDTIFVVLFRMGINHCVTMTIMQGMLASVIINTTTNVNQDYLYVAESLSWILGMFDGKPPTETSFWSLSCLVQLAMPEEAYRQITEADHVRYSHPDLQNARWEFSLWQGSKEGLFLLLWFCFPAAIVLMSYVAGFFMLQRHLRQKKQLYTEAVEFYWNVTINSLRVAKRKLMEHQRKLYVDAYFHRVNGIWSPADHMLYSMHYRRGRCCRTKISYVLFRQETHLLRNIVLFMTYAAVSRSFLRPMVCLQGLGGAFFMRTSPDLPCDVDNPVLWVSGLVGTAYLIIMPTFLYVRLWFSRGQLHLPSRLREWGLSTCGYKRDFWWWEPIVYMRKALCIAVEVLPSFSVSERLTSLLVIGLAYLLVTHALEPYDERCRGLFNWLEQLQLVIFVAASMLLKQLEMAIQWEGFERSTNLFVLLVPTAMVLMHVGFLIYLGYYLFDVFVDMAVTRMLPGDTNEEDSPMWRRRIKQWMFERYHAKVQACPYVSLDPMYGWVSLVGSHGATAVPPYIPKGLEAVARLRDQGLCRIPFSPRSAAPDEQQSNSSSSERQMIAHRPQERGRQGKTETSYLSEGITASMYFDDGGRQMRIFLTEAPQVPDGSTDVNTIKVANLWTRMELRNILTTAASRVATGQEAGATISTSLLDFVVRVGFVLHQKHRTSLEAVMAPLPQEIEKQDWLAAVASSDPAKLRGAKADLEADDLEDGPQGRIYMASALLMEEELHDKFNSLRKLKQALRSRAAHEVRSCCLQCARRSWGSAESHEEGKSRRARTQLWHEREALKRILQEGAQHEESESGRSMQEICKTRSRGPETFPQTAQEEMDLRAEVEELRAKSMALESEMRYKIKRTRFEATVDEMFRPSNYRQGIPLDKLEFALLRLQNMSREDLSLWLDIFEERWMHETVVAQRDLARNCGQVRDSENEAILSKAHKPMTQQVSDESLATWQPLLACDEAVQCVDLDVWSPSAAKTLQMQQLEEALDAVEVGIYVRWALMAIELTHYMEISSFKRSLRPSKLARLENQVKGAKDEADRETEKLSLMEWEYAQLLQKGQEDKAAKLQSRASSKENLTRRKSTRN